MTEGFYVNRLPSVVRLAHMVDGRLTRLAYDFDDESLRPGDVFVGQVTQVLAHLDAAFVDLGDGQTGFLNRRDLPHSLAGGAKTDMASALKPGRRMLVQIRKEPQGDKGARVDAEIRLVGFALIYLPHGDGLRYSRDYTGDKDRSLSQDGGWIVRAHAAALDDPVLEAEAETLQAQWRDMVEAAASGVCRRVAGRSVLDGWLRDFAKRPPQVIHFDDEVLYQQWLVATRQAAPALAAAMKLHQGDIPLFLLYKIESQIEDAFKTKLWLPSGGWLAFETREAMTVVDVNSGKNTGKAATAKANREAIGAVARHIRLRNLSGLIVVDLIGDMNKDVRRTLDAEIRKVFQQTFSGDDAALDVLPLSPLGLLEISRERRGRALHEWREQRCPACRGTGTVLSPEAAALNVMQQLLIELPGLGEGEKLLIKAGPRLATCLNQRAEHLLTPLHDRFGRAVEVVTDKTKGAVGFELVLVEQQSHT